MSILTIVILAGLVLLAVIFGASLIGTFNKLVTLKNRYQNAFAQIEVQLKRRYDLIPNMVEVAKGYMSHERETLEAVIQARNMAAGGLEQAAANPGDAAAIQGLASAEGVLTGTLGRLFALAEAYPDLKANQNMMQVSEELRSTEEQGRFRAPGVQRRGDHVQHLQAEVPGRHGRRNVRPRSGRDAARVRQRGDRRGAEYLVRLVRTSRFRRRRDGHRLLSATGRGKAGHDPPRRALLARGTGDRRLGRTPAGRDDGVPRAGSGDERDRLDDRRRSTAAAPGRAWHSRRGRRRQPVQDRATARRRARDRRGTGRPARGRQHLGPGRAAAAQRRGGDGDRLGHVDAARLHHGRRSGHQRVRRRLRAAGRGHRRDPRCGDDPRPRRTPGRHRPRVQPHSERRHAAEHPSDGPAARHLPHSG